MVYVNMEMPEEMEPFAMPPGQEGQLKRNAMILKWYCCGNVFRGFASDLVFLIMWNRMEWQVYREK